VASGVSGEKDKYLAGDSTVWEYLKVTKIQIRGNVENIFFMEKYLFTQVENPTVTLVVGKRAYSTFTAVMRWGRLL